MQRFQLGISHRLWDLISQRYTWFEWSEKRINLFVSVPKLIKKKDYGSIYSTTVTKRAYLLNCWSTLSIPLILDSWDWDSISVAGSWSVRGVEGNSVCSGIVLFSSFPSQGLKLLDMAFFHIRGRMMMRRHVLNSLHKMHKLYSLPLSPSQSTSWIGLADAVTRRPSAQPVHAVRSKL